MLKNLSREEKVLAALCVALVLIRFIAIGITPYLIDEPLFQVWAEEMLQTGKFRLVAMGGSSLPVSYGGGAIWLYSIPHLISKHPMSFVLFHTLIYSTGFFTLFLSLQKAFGRKIALYVTLLAGSSPFLFFFSRHAWDTTFFMPFTAASLFLLNKLSEDRFKEKLLGKNGILPLFFFLGLILAIAINIQLSCGPFVLLVGVASLLLWKQKNYPKNFLLGIVFLVSTVILLILPYLFEAWHVHLTNPPLVHKKINEHWGTGRHFWWNTLYSMTWLSTWQAQIFFEPVFSDFKALAGSFFGSVYKLDLLGWITKIFCLAGIFAPLIALITKKKIPFFLWIATLGFGISMLVFQYINIPMQPHYFQSFWWMPFVALAGFLFITHSIEKIWLKGIILLSVLTNVFFVSHSLAFLIRNEGTRGLHHGTGILETRRAVTQLCEEAKQKKLSAITLDVSFVFTPDNAIKYFFERETPCAELNLIIDRLKWPKATARLMYDSTTNTSARLVTEWKE